MYIIDESYFQVGKKIVNSLELNSTASMVLDQLIDNKARLLLKNALGYTLFKEFDSYVSNGQLKADAPQKWKDLVNGKEYTKSNELYKWQGLKFEDGESKQSLIADLVYYFWLENECYNHTGVGLVTANTANATNVNYNQILSKNWNDFIIQYQGNFNDYAFNFSWCDSDNYVSLLDFLNDNETDYPDASLLTFKLKNEFGI